MTRRHATPTALGVFLTLLAGCGGGPGSPTADPPDLPGQWGFASAVGSASARAARGSFAPNGEAMLVWEEEAGSGVEVHAARWSPRSGWGQSERVAVSDQGAFGSGRVSAAPRVALDGAGGALVAWRHVQDGAAGIAIARSSGAGWSQPRMLHRNDRELSVAAAAEVGAPHVIARSDGTMLVAWDIADTVWYEELPPGLDDGPRERVSVETGQHVGLLDAAATEHDVLLLWAQSLPVTLRPYAGLRGARRLAGSWERPVGLGRESRGGWALGRLAFDRQGDGVLVSQSLDPYNLHGAVTCYRAPAGGEWNAGDPFLEPGFFLKHAGADAEGEAWVLASKRGLEGGLWDLRHRKQIGWSAPVLLPGTAGLSPVTTVSLAVLGDGVAVAAIVDDDRLLLAEHYARAGWRQPWETGSGCQAEKPNLVAGPEGRALLTWMATGCADAGLRAALRF